MCASQLVLICLCFLLSSCYLSVSADEHNHKYNDGEEVVLWMSTVGPYHNRTETYAYFSLPFCSGYHEPRNATFRGVELKYSCRVEILKAFTHAVMNEYWYQMYFDGLPIWGKVGERDENDGKYYIYTHKRFDIGYNGQQIVDITLTTGTREELKADAKINFTYEVNWKPTEVDFQNRTDKYLDPNFLYKELLDPNFFKEELGNSTQGSAILIAS
ncbi:hypothetical protein ACLKA6_019148 [Drosophila palustris]